MIKLLIYIIFLIFLLYSKYYGLIKKSFINDKDSYIISNSLIVLRHPIKIDTSIGKLEIGNKNIINGMIVYFYSNNILKSAYLSKEHKIKTYYGNILIDQVSFYSNGVLKRIHLENPQIIKVNNNKLTVYDYINFYENGKIQSCFIYGINYDGHSYVQGINTRIGKFFLKNWDFVYFYRNGEFSNFTISIPAKIKTLIGNLEISDEIYFYENGNISECYVNGSCNINLKLKKFILDDIRYFESYNNYYDKYYNKNYNSYLLNYEIDNLKINDKLHLFFYETGELKKIELFNPILIYTSLGIFKIYYMSFYKSGAIEALGLYEMYAIREISNIYIINNLKFYESGAIKNYKSK